MMNSCRFGAATAATATNGPVAADERNPVLSVSSDNHAETNAVAAANHAASNATNTHNYFYIIHTFIHNSSSSSIASHITYISSKVIS